MDQGRKKLLSQDDYARLSQHLDALQPKRRQRTTLTAFLVALGDRLEKAKANGYTVKDLVHILKQNGVEASEATLRLALSRYRTKKKKEEKEKQKTQGRVQHVQKR